MIVMDLRTFKNCTQKFPIFNEGEQNLKFSGFYPNNFVTTVQIFDYVDVKMDEFKIVWLPNERQIKW